MLLHVIAIIRIFARKGNFKMMSYKIETIKNKKNK